MGEGRGKHGPPGHSPPRVRSDGPGIVGPGTTMQAASALWHAALRRYLGVVVLLDLLWEFAHLPLYEIWRTGSWSEVVFAALHCTGGDFLIALAALILALLLAGNSAWPVERFQPVAVVTILLGLTYTAFSEWLNIVIRAAWAYSDLMPVIPLLGFQVGLSPLLQWILVPLAGFWSVRQFARP